MMKLKKTDKALISVGKMLRKGLQDELKAQKHNATGKLSRGLRYHIKNNVLNIFSSVSYWKAVNNPLFAKKANFDAIKRWVNVKGLPSSSAIPIFNKLKFKYGKPYVFWTQGNSLRRTNFAGHTAKKFKDRVVNKIAPAIGKDVADMIKSQIKKNKKSKVS